MLQTVLLAGATGRLGGRIAHHLLDQPDARLRLMVRHSRDRDRLASLGPLLDRGAELIEADLADTDSLDRATDGADVIVSAVQGGPEVIVEGQAALAAAGKRNGVTRMLPSDFALDLFKAVPGEHPAFDARRTADERIAAIGLQQVNLLPGGFMEMFLSRMGAVDWTAGTISFWGDGERPIEMTSIEDAARMAARVAVDRDVQPGPFAFAGDRVSFRQAAAIMSAQTGHDLVPTSLGTEADLRALIAAQPEKKPMLAYHLYMLIGQTALGDLQSDRYLDLRLDRFEAFAARNLPARELAA